MVGHDFLFRKGCDTYIVIGMMDYMIVVVIVCEGIVGLIDNIVTCNG